MTIYFISHEKESLLLWGTFTKHTGYNQGVAFAQYLSTMNNPEIFLIIISKPGNNIGIYTLKSYLSIFSEDSTT